MTMVFETWLESDLQKPVQVKQLLGNLFSGDNGGNLIGVRIYDNGEPATGLSGNVYGYAILSNNATVTMSGTLSGNEASIILHEDVYKVIGAVSIVIKVGATTVGACTGYVYRTATETPLDPTGIVPDVATLLGKIAVWEAAAQGCQNVNITSVKSVTQNGNELSVTTTNRQNQSVNTVIREPEISATRSGKVVTITAKGTNAAGNGWKTPEVVQITEPTMTITPNDGDFDVNINGVKEVTIPNPNKELSDRAHVETVSRSKTRTGNPIQIEDAVNEIADKAVIKLVPRQDLHGYGKPWVAGSGKNKCSVDNVSLERTNSRTANLAIDSIPAGNYILSWKISGTSSHALVRFRNAADNTTVSSPGDTELVSATTTANITLTDTAGRIYFYIDSAQEAGKTAVISEFMLRPAGTEAGFEPYENICPISGYDTVNVNGFGDNLFDASNVLMYDVGVTGATGSNTDFRHTNLIKVNGSKCKLSFRKTDSTQRNFRLHGYDSNGNWLRQLNVSALTASQKYEYEVDMQSDVSYVVFSYCVNIADLSIRDIKVYPIAVSLATNGNQTAGTVYSGTVTLLADGSGQVYVDKVFKEYDGSSDETWASSTGGMYYRYAFTGVDQSVPGISNQHLWHENPAAMSGLSLNEIGYSSTTSYNQITVKTGDMYADAAAYKAYLAQHPLQVLMTLATPITYTLTANQVQTLLGYNYIYTDGAEIALTYRQESLATNETLLKLLPTGSASGNPVTFSDGADGVPLKQLVVNVEPKQEGSGTPSPTNIRPIRGWDSVPLLRTGENLVDVSKNTAQLIYNDDGTTTTNSAVTCTDFIRVKPNVAYTISGTNIHRQVADGADDVGVRFVFFDESKNFLQRSSGVTTGTSVTQTTPSNCGYIRSTYGKAGTDIMLQEASSATAFESYKGKTYDISIPSEAGTVYGGIISLDQNGEGTLVVDRAKYTFDGTETFSKYNSKCWGMARVDSSVKPNTANSNVADIVSDIFTAGTPNNVWNGAVDNIITISVSTDSNKIRFYSSGLVNSSASEVASYMQGRSFIYPLANPVTYSLTADQVKTLLGTNIISSDAGNVEVEYFKKLSDKGTGEYSHVEGRSTIASGLASHAEGDATEATGASAHSEGYSTHATGNNSHAEGMNSTASGDDAHAEGFLTTASGDFSHAEGSTATASGQSSHAEGKGTTANHLAQHVFGIFNVADPSTAVATAKGNYVEIVGNGESVSAKHNARTLDWNGNEWLAGSLTLGNTTLTEAKLAELVSISSATGVTF